MILPFDVDTEHRALGRNPLKFGLPPAVTRNMTAIETLIARNAAYIAANLDGPLAANGPIHVLELGRRVDDALYAENASYIGPNAAHNHIVRLATEAGA